MNFIMRIMCDSITLIKAEFRNIFRSYKTAIPFLVILFIPLLYAGMFLWAFWDPYGKTEELTVAIVNKDHGATIQDKKFNVGDELVASLKKDNTFTWKFLSEKEAKSQLKNKKIYMYIEIPKKFSNDVASLTSNNVKKAELIYVPNQGMNYIVSKINDTAVDKVKEKLSHKISETYAEMMFIQVEKAAEGIEKAANGSKEIGNGLINVQNGTGKMAKQLEEKKQGVNDLANGAQTLQSGLQTAKKGAATLQDGTSKLQEASRELSSGHQKLASGINIFSGKMNELAGGASQLTVTSNQLVTVLQGFVSQHPEFQTNRDVQTLLALSTGLQKGLNQFQPSVEKANQTSAQLALSSQKLSQGQTKVYGAYGTLLQGESGLVKGLDKLQVGAQSLAKGNQDVYGGWISLIDHLNELQNGQNKLYNGNQTLTENLQEAHQKASEIKGSDERYNMFSDPIKLTKKTQHEIPNYGTALSPYFLSMGLFVGIFVCTVIYPFRESAGSPKSGISWYISKTTVILFISLMQTLILDTVILQALGLHVTHTAQFVAFSFLTSITFAFLIQLLVASLSNVGRFLTIVIMVIQLTASGGTFPIELIPHNLQVLYNSLPMSYSITGLKSLISLNDMATMKHSAFVLSLYLGSFALLSAFAYCAFYRFGKKSA
ncbi:hypothetical protein CN918_31335 [Priestia megaterium]|nr:hypothetical protein CN918_31335 [Priestia megaterium]